MRISLLGTTNKNTTRKRQSRGKKWADKFTLQNTVFAVHQVPLKFEDTKSVRIKLRGLANDGWWALQNTNVVGLDLLV